MHSLSGLVIQQGGCGIPQEPQERRADLAGSSAWQNNASMLQPRCLNYAATYVQMDTLRWEKRAKQKDNMTEFLLKEFLGYA